MILEPIWYKYAVFDEDGFVSGIRPDAPQEAKDAYDAEQAKKREYMDKGEYIPR